MHPKPDWIYTLSIITSCTSTSLVHLRIFLHIHGKKRRARCSTGLNNVLLPTLFTLVNNIEQYCWAWIECNNIVQYCWQLWTMWAAKHCSILFSSVLHQPERFYACTEFGVSGDCSTKIGYRFMFSCLWMLTKHDKTRSETWIHIPVIPSSFFFLRSERRFWQNSSWTSFWTKAEEKGII
jgi:hypothetical protein